MHKCSRMALMTAFGIICYAVISCASPINKNNGALNYLQKYGDHEEARPGARIDEENITSALKDFQKFKGLEETGNETGVLDSETMALVNTSRYGVSTFGRKKRNAGDTPPNLCQDASLDCITQTKDGHTYAFRGNFYWKVLNNALAPGFPRTISDDWGGLEGNLDACVTMSNGKTYFFKGGRYWKFTNRNMHSPYPKDIQNGFESLPHSLDAALVWHGNGKGYFFKGNEYWGYDKNSNPHISPDYPKLISPNWPGLPADGVDAAILWENNVSYFFKGDDYWRFDDQTLAVHPGGYPRSTATEWFGCGEFKK